MAKQDTKTINGTKFTFQHPGARWYINLTDRCKNANGVLQQEKYTDELLENVVVKPTDINSLDDFGPGADYDMKTLQEVVQKAETFLNS